MNHAHEATDEMGDFAARHPHPTFVDRMTEQYDMEDQSQSADADVARFLLWMLLGLILVIGVIAGFCHFYKVWMAL